jgi:hypothetical protein
MGANDAASTDASGDATASDGFAGPTPAGPCGVAAAVSGLPAGIVELADLGHVGSVVNVTTSGSDRVLSVDSGGYWILWDAVAQRQIASGNRACATDTTQCPGEAALLAASTLLVQSGGTLQLRSARDDSLLASTTIASAASVGLSLDGTYGWAASSASLSVWSTSGSNLVTRTGNYASASIIGAPGALLVANGPAGSNVIEHIATTGGASTTTPAFLGTFAAWSLDAAHFLTLQGTAVRVYDAGGTSQGIIAANSPTQFGGVGSYFWTVESTGVNVYAIGGSATPVLTHTADSLGHVIASGPALGVLPYGINTFDVIHLDPAGVAVTTHSIPGAYLQAFGESDGVHWTVGGESGQVYASVTTGAPPVNLGCGAVLSTSGSPGGTAAVATTTGGVIIADVSASSPAIRGVFPFASSRVVLTSDAGLLGMMATVAFAQYHDDNTLRFVALPSGAVVSSIPRSWSTSPPLLVDFDMAAGGSSIVQDLELAVSPARTQEVTGLDGGVVLSVMGDSNNNTTTVRLAPGGSSSAAPVPGSMPTTNIYRDASLIGAAPGTVEGWLDDGRLLMAQYTSSPGALVCVGAAIFDPTGVMLAPTVPLPCSDSFDIVSPTRLYYGNDRSQPGYSVVNKLYDLTTGAVLWSPAAVAPFHSSAVGGFVIEQTQNLLVVEKLPP